MMDEEKNRDFIQLYRKHIDNIAKLAREHPRAYDLFMLFIKHMDGTNALCVSMQALTEIMNLSRQSISKSVKFLKDNGWICILKSGTSNVYIVNPEIVWTSYNNQKEYCRFKANILLSKSENNEYLNNPKASTHFKTIDTEFIKTIQENNKKYIEEYKKFKNNVKVM